MKLASALVSFTIFMGLGFQAVTPSPRPKTAPAPAPAVQPYDPDHLAPGEVACGRTKPGEANPCKCIEHRLKASEAAQLQCELVSDRKERAKCMVSNEICSIVPIDVDHAEWNHETGERMPAQCRRSCTKARCECCKS